MKTCPFCAKEIQDAAIICKHCGREVSSGPTKNKELMSTTNFTERMMGAALCDVATYEEVEHDKNALGQAAVVVILSGLAAGIGALNTGGVTMFLGGASRAILSWVIWALITYLIGTKLLPEPSTQADLGQLLRTTGFAAAPGVLSILGIVPLLSNPINFIIPIWTLATMIVAVRQALDYSTTMRAVGVVVSGYIFVLGAILAISMLF